MEIAGSRMGHLRDALPRAYDALGFDKTASGDDVFKQLILARIIEPTSKEDSSRVIEETWHQPASYPTIKRRLPGYAAESWRKQLAAACASKAALGPASLILYDVTKTIQIQAGRQTITAADPLPDDLRQALDAINNARQGVH